MAKCSSHSIRFQGPMDSDAFDRALHQSAGFPDVLKVAMTIRTAVFVREQGVPAAMEVDADDARSCHLVIYDETPGQAESVPVGTIRMVPFPHSPHPLPGSSWDVHEDSEDSLLTLKPPPWITDRVTSLHDGVEPYIKLGRLAVLRQFRGRKFAGFLVNSAIEWLEDHPDYFNPSLSRAFLSDGNMEPDAYRTTWKGLICVHAQESVVNAWAKWGFIVDNEMGKWTEAGIPHVGMFKRVQLSKTAAGASVSNNIKP